MLASRSLPIPPERLALGTSTLAAAAVGALGDGLVLSTGLTLYLVPAVDTMLSRRRRETAIGTARMEAAR